MTLFIDWDTIDWTTFLFITIMIGIIGFVLGAWLI